MINEIISIYDQFISIFPPMVGTIISLLIFVAIVVGIWRLVKKSLIWLLLLVIFIPASIPLLKSIFSGVFSFLSHILS